MPSVSAKVIESHTRAYRRAFIKRRNLTTGQFEDNWFEISEDVKKWGKINSSVDITSNNKVKFNNISLRVANDEGKFNPEDNPNSYWFNFANRQRTLVRIDFGFLTQTLGADGIWTTSREPGGGIWDEAEWDVDIWDVEGANSFVGILSGDQLASSKNETSLLIKPLTQVFVDYPARKIDGWTSTGITASKFVEMLRDQTDGSGNFVFRPFFNNSADFFEIVTTTAVYPNLNTSTAKDIIDKNCWQVVEKLTQAENFVPQVKHNGIFKFGPKNISTSSSFSFYGAGVGGQDNGVSIKKINSFGKKMSNYYSRVQLKWQEADTSTSYEVQESQIEVAGGNGPWNFGYRTFSFENLWINSTATAATLTAALFTELSSLKREINFTSSFVPNLDILDFIDVSYDTGTVRPETLWDENDWDTELTWDDAQGDTIFLENEEFKILNVAHDLDKLETTFIARET